MANDNVDQDMYPPLPLEELKNAHAYENLARVVVTQAGAVYARYRDGGWVRLDHRGHST